MKNMETLRVFFKNKKGQWAHAESRVVRSHERGVRIYRTKILLSRGYKPSKIAVTLGVSTNTVKTYIEECKYIKLSDAKKYFTKFCPKCGTLNDMFDGYYDKCKKCGADITTKLCFIATATYETPFAPEIVILKRWRDEVLVKSFYGKLFIKIYYFVSPSIGSIISKSYILKRLMRIILNCVVEKVKK